MSKRKLKQSGSKGLVSSKFENTKKQVDDTKGLIQYRRDITSMSKDIKEYAVGLTPNLLSVKMSLMGAVREVEKMMKERREG